MAKPAPRPELASPFDPADVPTALRKQRPVCAVTLIIYAVLQLLYITATPLQTIELPDNLPQKTGAPTRLLVGIGPDEKEYLLYIRSLADRQALPAPAPRFRHSDDDYVSYQVQHPPLFFVLAALLYRLITPLLGVAAYWYVIRIICAACGAGAVLFASRAAAVAFPESDFIVYAAPPALAFLPIFAHMCGNLSSEPLEMMLGALAWLQMIEMVRGSRPRSVANAAWLGLTLALAALSKLTAVIYIPAALIALSLPLASQNRQKSTILSRLAAFVVPILTLLLPWFLRNRLLLGAWFPRPFDRPQLAGITLLEYLKDVNQPLFIAGLPRPIVITPLLTALWYASTAWAPFWLIQFYLPGGMQTAPAWQAIGLLAIVAPLLMLFLHASRSRREAGQRDAAGAAILWMAGLTVTCAVAGVLQQQLYADWDAINSAGRYFVAAAPTGTLILLFALSTSLRGAAQGMRIAAGIVAAILLALDVSTALLVRQFYRDHPEQAAVQRVDGS